MKCMVIDGNSIINRAFYGVRPLSTRDGTPTNAVYGFLNILLKLLDEEKPDALCVAFDRKAPTFRHKMFDAYKATRHAMPDDLAAQMPILKDVLRAMNVPLYELDGWEADDILGTIAQRDTEAGWETVLVTGDKDSLQLITDTTTVKLVTTRMGQTTTKDMTPETFRAEYGFEPIHIIDLKALMGDASDNIPGVKGVGEKTAMGLVQMYGSIDHLYDHMPGVCTAPRTPAKPGMVKKLEEGREDAKFSYTLATIRRDAPVEFVPEDAVRKKPDNAALYALFVKLEFAKLIEKFGLTAPQGDAPAGEESFTGTCVSETVTDKERMEELLDLFAQRSHVAFLALPGLNGVCVEWDGEDEGRSALFFPDKLPCYNDFLRRFFSPAVKKVTHGVKAVMGELLGEGLSTEGFVFDTEIAAYLLAPTDGSYELDKLALRYFKFEAAKATAYTGPDAFAPLADPAPALAALMSHTALVDALYETLSGRIEELGLHEVFYDIDLPLCPVLAEMERAGVLIDRKTLEEYGEMLTGRIADDEALIYQMAGQKFNINSTQQLGKILFEDMGIPPVKKTKTGYSTSAEVLEKLRGQAPMVDAVLDYRQLAKLKSTYVEGLTKVIAADGRVHTSFQNTVTATGRLSSTEPNLQNIPVRTELGAQLRYMLVAPKGYMLVDADYSQIELRLLAHIADDKTMQQAFLSGEDIHTATAAQVFGLEPGQVTPEMRRRAKAVNFGMVYGISPFSLSQDIHVSVAEAKEYMERYFATFHGVRDYMERVVKEAKERGCVATLYGRRRWLPELKSANFNLRSFGERVALNMPIQGTAADLMKLAMIRVRNALLREGLEGRLVLQVHDELIVECPEGEVEAVKALLEREMTGVAELKVPLVADAAAGRSWGEAH